MIVNGVTLPDIPAEVLEQYPYSETPEAEYAERYSILGSILVGTARQIMRLTDSTEKVKPEEFEPKLEGINIQLQELTVTATEEVQTITPPSGIYGFSKVIVEAVEDSGGTGGGGTGEGGDDDTSGGAAENTTFGDEYTEEEVETGLYDYSGGTDENPSYIPEIPDGKYKMLFNMKLKAGKTFRYSHNGESYDLKSDYDVYVYSVYRWVISDDGKTRYNHFSVIVCSGTSEVFLYNKKTSVESWGQAIETDVKYGDNYYKAIYGSSGHSSYVEIEPNYGVSGIPFFNLGKVSTTGYEAFEAFTTAGDSGKDQFIAFVSDSPIYYDGNTITNADGSPMTIYQCNSADTNTWEEIGTTDGTGYPVGGNTRVWNSHDVYDLSGESVTFSASDAPIAETKTEMVGNPVERNETYTIDGNTMNSLVSTAQKITGSQNPLTPDQATNALEEYYNQPRAEELTF